MTPRAVRITTADVGGALISVVCTSFAGLLGLILVFEGFLAAADVDVDVGIVVRSVALGALLACVLSCCSLPRVSCALLLLLLAAVDVLTAGCALGTASCATYSILGILNVLLSV